MFKGSYTALITPFRDGEIDDRAFQELVDWQIREGSDGLVPVGTTGESPTLSHEEHERVVVLCVEAAAGRVPVIAGTGSNSTAEAVSLTKHAKAAGADGALVVMPYYNKPTPEGQYRHFEAVALAADIPVIIYNIPGRSVVDMTPQTMARLAQISNIVGVKDATSDPVRPTVTRLTVGKSFCQLSGEDGSVLAFLAHGGVGCISVTANIAPALCAGVHKAWQAGDTELAMALHEALMPLHQSLFVESSPGPVKYAAAQLGLCTGEMRLPMTEVSGATKEKVRSALASVGLLEAEKTEWRAAT